MRRFRPLGATATATLLLAATSVAAASTGSLPLSARLIRASDFPGYSVQPGRTAYRTIRAWAAFASSRNLPPAQAASDRARLRREGFRGGLSEYLERHSIPQSGVSWVAQFGSAAAARSELTLTLRESTGGGPFSTFAVAGVPGARAWRVAGNFVGENVLFTDGPFLYLVGQGWSPGEPNPPTRAGLVAAVQRLYRRVHGR